MMEAANVLSELARPWHVAINSDSVLVGSVAAAAAEDDKQRQERDLEPLRRKPELQPMPAKEVGLSIHLTTWDVLHTLGRAMVLDRQGAGRGLAEHWGALKYSQALTGNPGDYMTLSGEGHNPMHHYKALQSRELGKGFALALAKHLLSQRYPDHSVSIVAADPTLRAGWALTSKDSGHSAGYRYRPLFFAEIWKPGEPSRVIPIACKGNHSGPSTAHAQLASASVHVEAVHIGSWNETPVLVFSTELPEEGPLTIHALQARGGGVLAGTADVPSADLDQPIENHNIYPGIRRPAKGEETPIPVPGFHIQPEHYAWFRQVLARVDAAGLTAFSGGGEPTVQYLTKRQGQHHFTGFAHAAAGSVQDAEQTLHGIHFVGTDHIFRLNGTRVEAFSGVAAHLFEHLKVGHVKRYRSEVHTQRSTWQRQAWDARWGGPVSVHQDGSILAMRLLP